MGQAGIVTKGILENMEKFEFGLCIIVNLKHAVLCYVESFTFRRQMLNSRVRCHNVYNLFSKNSEKSI